MAGAVSANGQLFLKGLAMGATAERQFHANIAQSLVYCLDDARPGSINFDALKPMQSPTGGCVAPQGTGKSLKCRMCPGFAATTNNAPESLFTEPWTVLDNVITIGFGASEERQERRLKACKWLERHLDPAAGVETHEALRRDFVIMLLQFVNKAQDPATKAAIAQRMHHLKLRQYLGRQAAERNAATAAAVATSTVDDATRVKEWLEEGCRITHIRPEDRMGVPYLRRSDVARAALGKISESKAVAAVINDYVMKEFKMKPIMWNGVKAFRGLRLSIPIAPH